MRSLYWKICVTFLVVVLVSLVAGRAVFHATMSRRLHGGGRPPFMDMGRSMGQFVSWGIEKYAREGLSLVEAGKKVQALLPEPRHLSVVVLDQNHHPVVGELPKFWGRGADQGPFGGSGEPVGPLGFGGPGGPGAPDDANDADGPGGRGEPGEGRGAIRHRFDEPVLVPVTAGKEHGFVLCVMRPPGPPDDFWPMVLQTAGAALATVFVVASLLGLVVFRLLTRRLDQLQRCVAGIANGDLELRVAAPGSDEIGDLGRSLNRMAERLQHSVGELNETDRKRRALLADISHELKTPLTVLRGHLEEVLDTPDANDPHRVSVSIAFAESERLALLIDDLLELARFQSSEFRLARKEVVLQRVVQRAVDRFQLSAANRQINLTARLTEEPLRMMVDHRRLEQVVANLVQNALKHVEVGGTIEVSVEPKGDGAQICISDNGRGMTPAELETAFDRFKTGSVDHGSTGLGLSIVKQLVEAHDGTVHLESRASGGIRAVVIL